jgi:ATP-dependent Clp protease ATP-binding subunit ClpA
MSFKGFPPNADLARALKLCGGDPTTTKSERHEAREPRFPAQMATSLKDAAADARRLGQSAVEPHNILVGLLRADRPELNLTYLWVGGVDIARLRRHLGERLTTTDTTNTNAELPLSTAARNAMTAALDRTRASYQEVVEPRAMLLALAASDDGVIADMLRAAGSTPARLRHVLSAG